MSVIAIFLSSIQMLFIFSTVCLDFFLKLLTNFKPTLIRIFLQMSIEKIPNSHSLRSQKEKRKKAKQ